MTDDGEPRSRKATFAPLAEYHEAAEALAMATAEIRLVLTDGGVLSAFYLDGGAYVRQFLERDANGLLTRLGAPEAEPDFPALFGRMPDVALAIWEAERRVRDIKGELGDHPDPDA